MLLIKTFITIILIFTSFSIYSEYRVYQYRISTRGIEKLEGKTFIIVSTLDPIGFSSYHGGGDVINIDLLRTWMCYGNTAKKDICHSPLKEHLNPKP